ncbi:MAG: hypothetical protein HFP81_01750 [Methylococcales symbiont of Hymedesmia sp. n. MRB-2018]|nr:MAG: hypothetical protein HFP78_03110 [Methylococcales symbiont of Hymedesmia sp. n. MRB-2018]KAF3984501.1 MAG: hypothetical protein HFP81_01750 [Methylococcales symbiont of Hymedesmia sp. n. MRB-2018]
MKENFELTAVDQRYSLFTQIRKIQILLSVLFLCVILPSTAFAHRGSTNEIDTCRISVGDEVIHFTAYTAMTGGTGLCHVIPYVGPADLVFDYEGQKLRKTTVEFEITKEPEGTRVFYQAPEKIKKGTVDAKVDFTPYGEGNYLAHITIEHEGRKLDSHLPFSVGLESAEGGMSFMVIFLLLVLVVVVLAMIVMSRSKKNKEPLD